MTSEVISTAVSPEPVARESGLGLGVGGGGGGGGGDHGAVVGGGHGRGRGFTAAFRALHDDFSISSSLKALFKKITRNATRSARVDHEVDTI